ncbi:MAG TPA: hypothetical protein H9839_07560 [Candidatus Intestinimonas stercorigallinarum]|nr:hypothetical protein [Candidatus Intestinimonas stercorigallinarum]
MGLDGKAAAIRRKNRFMDRVESGVQESPASLARRFSVMHSGGSRWSREENAWRRSARR